MKKAFFLVLLVISKFLFAQSNLSVGTRAGINLIPTSKDEVTGRSFYTQFNGGVFVSKQLRKKMNFKLEVNYTRKVKQYQFTEKSSLLSSYGNVLSAFIDPAILSSLNDTVYSNYRGINKLGFIEIPLIVTFNVKQFDIGLGAYSSFLIAATTTQELTQRSTLIEVAQPFIDSLGITGLFINSIINGAYPGLKSPYVTESSNKNDFVKVDYGFIADVTYHYTPNFFFNFRYQYGLPNYRITALKKPDNYSSLTFSFGYQFNFKKRNKEMVPGL